MDEQLDVAGAAAARHHVRVQAVGEVDDLLLALAQRAFRFLHVGQIHDLNLADQNRVRRFGLETAASADQLACRAHGCDDRRLFDDHRHDVLLIVDDQVHAEPERHAHDADDVLDHLVGGVEIERMLARGEGAEIRSIDEPALVHGPHALFDAQLVELGYAPSVATHALPPRAVLCHQKAVLGQRDVDHSKTPIPNRFPESVEPSQVVRAGEPKVAAPGPADLVRDAVAPCLGVDLTMLGRDDLRTDRVTQAPARRGHRPRTLRATPQRHRSEGLEPLPLPAPSNRLPAPPPPAAALGATPGSAQPTRA